MVCSKKFFRTYFPMNSFIHKKHFSQSRHAVFQLCSPNFLRFSFHINFELVKISELLDLPRGQAARFMQLKKIF